LIRNATSFPKNYFILFGISALVAGPLELSEFMVKHDGFFILRDVHLSQWCFFVQVNLEGDLAAALSFHHVTKFQCFGFTPTCLMPNIY
jgi:hypothetical protein